MKTIRLDTDKFDALQSFWKTCIALEQVQSRLYSAVDELEEKQILKEEQQLEQERLKARKILESKNFKKYMPED